MNQKYDLIIVGAGPSSAFMACELVKLKKNQNVLIIEQGRRVEQRVCPIEKGKCLKCKPLCSITNGFSGAGAFSDGKLLSYHLSLFNENEDKIYVGGTIDKYIETKKLKELIAYTDEMYLSFGADKKLNGIEHRDKIRQFQVKAKKENLDLIDIPIRHLGTEKSHELYKRIQDYLLENNINIMFDTSVTDLIIENGKILGVKTKNSKDLKNEEVMPNEIYADKVVLGVGRKGASWLSDMCLKHNIETKIGSVDIGVRYELPDKVMKEINEYMYEGKFIGRVGPYKDKVRTFCQNPSGFVSAEVYDDELTLVNGHSYKERKSENTNLAILVSHNFNYPFKKPIDYGKNIAENMNQLGAGNIVVQRLGDIYRGKRTWEEELNNNSVKPTLKSAVAGDVTYALGYRTMTGILEFIKSIDKVVEGFGHPDNLLYGPEIKFYSNQVVVDKNFETTIKNLYCIGDGGGLTTGLMMASASGIQMARNLYK